MELKRRIKAAMKGFRDPDLVVGREAFDQISGLEALAKEWSDGPLRWERVKKVASDALASANLRGGKMLEIGGRRNPRDKAFPGFEYYALDLDGAPGAKTKVMVGDITECPQIESESIDFIFSLDVFEHIAKPWLAGAEIQRILRPGGVTVHSTLFSWRYHPCPIDYWRYSAEGLRSLFPDLLCLYSDFDAAERRRDIRGKDGNKVEIDALGGWRENVRVHYAGLKRG
ncbi:MAG: methyltransferase domain-containing protein [Rhodobacter sp.]|nr:methyltransferase domain-containing protein [Rhodobacter sp.]